MKMSSPNGPPHLSGHTDEIPLAMWNEWKSVGGDAVWSFKLDEWRRRIHCRCGNWETLEIRYADVTNPHWSSGEFSGNLRAEIACSKCAAEFLLFDEGLHGYNAVVCDERGQLPANYVESNRRLLERQTCSCAGSTFAVIAGAAYDCEEEEEEELGIPAAQRDEAYGCFRAIVRCSKCGSIRELFVAETA